MIKILKIKKLKIDITKSELKNQHKIHKQVTIQTINTSYTYAHVYRHTVYIQTLIHIHGAVQSKHILSVLSLGKALTQYSNST